jgi:hypothetical protein
MGVCRKAYAENFSGANKQMKLFNSWTFKEYTAVGVTAALCIVMGVLIKVVLGLFISNIPAVGSLVLGMIQAIIIGLSIMRLPRLGFLTILGVCMGTVYGFIFPAHPFMFVTFILAGMAGDCIAWLLGGYQKQAALIIAVLTFRLSVIVFGALIAWWIGFAETDLAWTLILINSAGSAVGVLIGLWAAVKLSKELSRAGLLAT